MLPYECILVHYHTGYALGDAWLMPFVMEIIVHYDTVKTLCAGRQNADATYSLKISLTRTVPVEKYLLYEH